MHEAELAFVVLGVEGTLNESDGYSEEDCEDQHRRHLYVAHYHLGALSDLLIGSAGEGSLGARGNQSSQPVHALSQVVYHEVEAGHDALNDLKEGDYHEEGDGGADEGESERVLDLVGWVRLSNVHVPVSILDEFLKGVVPDQVLLGREVAAPPILLNGEDQEARDEDADCDRDLQVEVRLVDLVVLQIY